ncbi:hypothetical protein N7528_003348 [Penicillium herquei]|nr:hypothetical protein N7528_003348 [Penicillium herquei]
MPVLPTSQAFLEQSALLLQAYPETTRITTKYHYPTERRAEKHKRQRSQAKKPSETESTPSIPIAAFVLKTYNPSTGICLKYQTNKLQEVGRLVTGLGKLAAGADVASLGLSGAGPVDVEMVDVNEDGTQANVNAPANANAGAKSKGKKKGGKGKR